jgi:hypothetical protein
MSVVSFVCQLMHGNHARRAVTAIFLPALVLWSSGDALAQSSGMFGPRVLGTTIRPGASQFDGGLQIAPSGAFLGAGRANGDNMLSKTWRHSSEAPFYVPSAYAVSPSGQLVAITSDGVLSRETPLPVAFPPQPTVPADVIGQPEGSFSPQNMADYGPTAYPGSTPSPVALPGEGAATFNNPPSQRVAPPAVAPAAVESGFNGSAIDRRARSPFSFGKLDPSSIVNAGLHNGYWPELSERLTRIAREHGMQVPSPIRVSFVDGTAVLRGVVGSPHDRTLIANMARLEPGVEQINNQMSIVSEGMTEQEGRPATGNETNAGN